MTKAKTALFLALVAPLACAGGASDPIPPRSAPSVNSPMPPPSSSFQKIWGEFLPEYLRREPVEATSLGDHEHDGEWPDLSAEGRQDNQRFFARIRAEIAALPKDAGTSDDRLDLEVLSNKIDTLAFEGDELRPEETDPRRYTEMLGAGLDALVTRDFAPEPQRAKSLAKRLGATATVVRTAKQRLTRPPRIVTETAVRQAKGLIGLVEGGFPELLAAAPAERAEVLARAGDASKALHELVAFFEGDLLARSDGTFRVGPTRFRRILELTLDKDVDPDALLASARATLATTQEEMAGAARELWPSLKLGPLPTATTPAGKKAMIKKALDTLAEDRSTNATIIADAAKTLADATAFVRAHDLVGLPDQPCKVMELPEYRRGVAIAYCDWAGPLEVKAETHVSISPVPADWPLTRATSFYREYNASMLADLMVHEAMPGHYLQGAHAAAVRASPRAIFTNDAYVEGWAVYAEWLMAKFGFGGPRVRLQRLKMLARVAANTILDHEIHAGSMEEKAALDLMENEAFQEEGEAVGKWTRARVSHGQLSQYLYGFLELMKLREAAEKQPGFQERAYHDKILSYGAPSVHQLRARMAL